MLTTGFSVGTHFMASARCWKTFKQTILDHLCSREELGLNLFIGKKSVEEMECATSFLYTEHWERERARDRKESEAEWVCHHCHTRGFLKPARLFGQPDQIHIEMRVIDLSFTLKASLRSSWSVRYVLFLCFPCLSCVFCVFYVRFRTPTSNSWQNNIFG